MIELKTLRKQDLDWLGRWVKEWQMGCISDKCEVFYFHMSNSSRAYLTGRALECVEEQRDLEVQVNGSLKVVFQIDRTAKKTFAMYLTGKCNE